MDYDPMRPCDRATRRALISKTKPEYPRGLRCGLLAAFASVIPFAHAFEASDVLVFSKGPVSLRPQFTVYSEYNSNILFREKDVEGDFLHVASPGLKILAGDDLPGANHIALQYRLDKIWYMDRSDLDATQHRIGLGSRYGTGRTEISGEDKIEFLSGTIGAGLTLGGRKVDRMVVSDIYRLDYRISERTGVYGSVLHDLTDFEGDVFLFDSQTLEGTLGFKWIYTPDTFFFGEMHYADTELSPNADPVDPPDNTRVGGFVGTRGKFTEKFGGLAKVGLESNETEKSISGAFENSHVAPIVEADLFYNFTDRTAASFVYVRQQRVSVQYTRATYVIDQISLGLTSTLGSVGRLRVSATGRLAFIDYEPSPAFASRNDYLWGFNVGVNWNFQTWLWTFADFDTSQFRTDLPGAFDYDQHRVRIGVEVGY
jgi:hypothetical protein